MAVNRIFRVSFGALWSLHVWKHWYENTQRSRIYLTSKAQIDISLLNVNISARRCLQTSPTTQIDPANPCMIPLLLRTSCPQTRPLEENTFSQWNEICESAIWTREQEQRLILPQATQPAAVGSGSRIRADPWEGFRVAVGQRNHRK